MGPDWVCRSICGSYFCIHLRWKSKRPSIPIWLDPNGGFILLRWIAIVELGKITTNQCSPEENFNMRLFNILPKLSFQGEFIRKKSTEGLPFPIILTGTLISFLWFLYGVVTRENFVIFQNGAIFLMSIVQLSLFAIYPSKPAKSKKSPSKSSNNNNKKKN